MSSIDIKDSRTILSMDMGFDMGFTLWPRYGTQKGSMSPGCPGLT